MHLHVLFLDMCSSFCFCKEKKIAKAKSTFAKAIYNDSNLLISSPMVYEKGNLFEITKLIEPRASYIQVFIGNGEALCLMQSTVQPSH